MDLGVGSVHGAMPWSIAPPARPTPVSFLLVQIPLCLTIVQIPSCLTIVRIPSCWTIIQIPSLGPPRGHPLGPPLGPFDNSTDSFLFVNRVDSFLFDNKKIPCSLSSLRLTRARDGCKPFPAYILRKDSEGANQTQRHDISNSRRAISHPTKATILFRYCTCLFCFDLKIFQFARKNPQRQK